MDHQQFRERSDDENALRSVPTEALGNGISGHDDGAALIYAHPWARLPPPCIPVVQAYLHVEMASRRPVKLLRLVSQWIRS